MLFLRSLGETTTENCYFGLGSGINKLPYRSEEIKTLYRRSWRRISAPTGPIDRENVTVREMALRDRGPTARATKSGIDHSCLWARVTSEVQDKLDLFIPHFDFVFTNKLDEDAKLLRAFDAFVLSKLLGREVGLGKIIHGDDRTTLNVKNRRSG